MVMVSGEAYSWRRLQYTKRKGKRHTTSRKEGFE